MKKVLYILSLGHSGSTILDISLSRHPSAIGLGELGVLFRNKKAAVEGTESVCGCGKDIDQCDVWSGYQEAVKNMAPDDVLQKYQSVLNLPVVKEKDIIIDSSKDINLVNKLSELDDKGVIDLQVIFLIRDARGWVRSMQNVDKNAGHKRRTGLYYLLKWYRRNRRLQRELMRNNCKYIQLGYDEFCSDMPRMMNLIFEHSNIDASVYNASSAPCSHIAYGNRMKKDLGGRYVKYDIGWQYSYKFNLLLVMLPNIFRWNSKQVYSNTR